MKNRKKSPSGRQLDMAIWPFKSKKIKALTTDDIREALLANNRTKSGSSVTNETALKVATVFACCKVIAEGIENFKNEKRNTSG